RSRTNRSMKRGIAVSVALAANTALAAQAACDKGPGVPFGILEYSCANCTVDHPAGQPRSYVFRSDPVVAEVVKDTPYQPGDAISAVDEKGLITPEGARAFAYPKPGPVIVQIVRTPPGQKP